MAKEELSFYDVRNKAKFKSKDWNVKVRGGRHFAVAVNPKTKGECWRILSAEQAGVKPKVTKSKAKKK